MKPENRKKLLAIILAGASICLALLQVHYWRQDHSQYKNLRLVEDWLIVVEPQINSFAKSEGVDLKVGSYTDYDGSVMVLLMDVDDAQTSRTMEFIRTLRPPRPVWWHIEYTDDRMENFLNKREEVKVQEDLR